MAAFHSRRFRIGEAFAKDEEERAKLRRFASKIDPDKIPPKVWRYTFE